MDRWFFYQCNIHQCGFIPDFFSQGNPKLNSRKLHWGRALCHVAAPCAYTHGSHWELFSPGVSQPVIKQSSGSDSHSLGVPSLWHHLQQGQDQFSVSVLHAKVKDSWHQANISLPPTATSTGVGIGAEPPEQQEVFLFCAGILGTLAFPLSYCSFRKGTEHCLLYVIQTLFETGYKWPKH